MTGYFTIDKAELQVDKKELKRRLSLPADFDTDELEQMSQEVLLVCTPKCSCICTPVTLLEENCVDLGFDKVISKNLHKALQGCDKAFVFAVTLGHGVDRLLTKLSVVSKSKHFVCDGYASALAESLCDKAELAIKEDKECKCRFSPGYGDLDISFQKQVLCAVNAQKLLGITLTESLLMTPQKSITAIMGIKNNS